MPAASALAQSGGDEIFTTAATGLADIGLADIGPADLSWFAADVEVADADPVQDPAAGAAGFLLVDRGGLMVTADGGRRTLLDDGDLQNDNAELAQGTDPKFARPRSGRPRPESRAGDGLPRLIGSPRRDRHGAFPSEGRPSASRGH